MPGFLKASLSLNQAQSLLSKFEPISVDALLNNSETPRLHRIQATLLYVSQPSKKLTFAKSSRGYGSSQRKIEVEKYHRFVVFGVPGTSNVVALFSPNSEESRRLFRYSEALRPGLQVAIIKGIVEGQLSRGGTPLISTKEPLVPMEACSSITLPPYDVEGTSTEFHFYSFCTKSLRVDSAVIAENCCSGNVCDSQTFHDPCGCTESSQDKIWVLLVEFSCNELNRDVHNGDLIQLFSNSSTDIFVAKHARGLKPDSEALDRFQLDETVQEIVQSINENQGFRIVGWFKPATDEEGTAVEHKRFHVCSLSPEMPLSEGQLSLKFTVTPPSSGNWDNSVSHALSRFSGV